jgi:hypothetical protein
VEEDEDTEREDERGVVKAGPQRARCAGMGSYCSALPSRYGGRGRISFEEKTVDLPSYQASADRSG